MVQPLDHVLTKATGACIKAEEALKGATLYYEDLIAAEQAIVDHPEANERDKRIARRGVRTATRIHQLLKSAWPEPENCEGQQYVAVLSPHPLEQVCITTTIGTDKGE